MTSPSVWWLMTFALIALELITGTIYALLVAIGFAVGAVAAHLGASIPIQVACAAVACIAFVGVWYLRASHHPKQRLADMQIDVGEQVSIAKWGADGSAQTRYRGANWQVKSVPGATTAPGLHRIVDVEGNTLVVEFIG